MGLPQHTAASWILACPVCKLSAIWPHELDATAEEMEQARVELRAGMDERCSHRDQRLFNGDPDLER